MRLLKVDLLILLWLGFWLGTAPAAGSLETAVSLDLRSSSEQEVPAGEPFYLSLLVENESAHPLRIAPVYFISRDYLELEITADDGSSIEPTYGAADIRSRINPNDFELLYPREITGQKLVFSPLLPEGMNHIPGLVPGCYHFRAILRLHRFEEQVSFQSGPPVFDGTVASEPESVCFGPPKATSLIKFRAQLSSDDLEEVMEALNYFANVPDQLAAEKIRHLAGPPQGWLERFPSPFHILAALRAQDGTANLPFFEEAVGSRYDDLARQGILRVRTKKP